MKTAFLLAALALPNNPQSDFYLFKWYIEKTRPDLMVIYVHPDEKLLYPKAEETPIRIGEPSLRVWVVRRSA